MPMPDLALFEYQEQWGGQAATWIRLHKPDCHIYADYYGVTIAGAWDHLSIEERRALVVVMESAAHYHAKRRELVDSKPTVDTPPANDGRIWTGQNWSET